MRLSVTVEARLNRAAIRAKVRQGRDQLVERVATTAAERARFFAPYDSGRLEESIEAVFVAPGEWHLIAATPYALIQELRHPYLYSGALDAMQQIQTFAREILG
jgi:hypothetical protein